MQAVDVQGDFFVGVAFWDAAKCHVRVLRLAPVGLAKFDDGSTVEAQIDQRGGFTASPLYARVSVEAGSLGFQWHQTERWRLKRPCPRWEAPLPPTGEFPGC